MVRLTGVLALLAGCFGPDLSGELACGNHGECPVHMLCFEPEQVCRPSICTPDIESKPCTTAAVPDGTCRNGSCALPSCGDHIVDTGEACDDGNFAENDGCSPQCTLEMCGNGTIEHYASTNEQCDDGRADLQGDGCSSTCAGEREEWVEVAFDTITGVSDNALAYDSVRQRVVSFGGKHRTEVLAQTLEWDGLTWKRIGPITSPPKRYGHRLAYDATRNEVVLFGGLDVGGIPLDDTWVWNGITWTERLPAHRPPPRALFAMANDPDSQRVLLYGGIGVDNAYQGDLWFWDGSDWTQQPSVPGSVNGGETQGAYDVVRHRFVISGYNETVEFDGTSWVQTPKAFVELGPLVYSTERAKVLTVDFGNADHEVRTYEWTGAEWTELAILSPSISHGALADDVARGLVVGFGGFTEVTTTFTLGASNVWNQVEPAVRAPDPTIAAHLAYDSDRNVLVLNGGLRPLEGVILDDTWEFDGTWHAITPSSKPTPIVQGMMAYDPVRRRHVRFGGYTGTLISLTLVRETWEYNSNSQVWLKIEPATTSPTERISASMVFDPKSGRILMFGGDSQNGLLNELWSWDGTDWSLITQTGDVPPPMEGASFVFDATEGHLVLFGGETAYPSEPDHLSNETYVLDGTTWTRKEPIHRPSPRTIAYADYDPIRGSIVLAGGADNVDAIEPHLDAWEWKHDDWTPLRPPSPSTMSAEGVAVYDAARRRFTIIHGYGPTTLLNMSLHRYETLGTTVETCDDLDGGDRDGDGLAGCSDPDCWFACTPRCPPMAKECP